MDEELRQLERLFTADSSLENAATLYIAYIRTGQDFEAIRGTGVISEELLEQMMAQELIPIDEDFFHDTETCENIMSRAETLVDEAANASAAQAWSNTEDQDEIIIAYFGEAVAVNGVLLRAGDGEIAPLTEAEYQKQLEIPEDFRRSNRGGRVPDTEEEIQADWIVEMIAREMKVSENIVNECLGKRDRSRGGNTPFLGKEQSEIYTSVSGETESYKRDPLFPVYQAKNITELQEAIEGMGWDEFNGVDSRSGIDLDRVPTWGEETIRVGNLLRETNRWEGLFSWDTTGEDPIFLHFEMSHDGKKTIETTLFRESDLSKEEESEESSD